MLKYFFIMLFGGVVLGQVQEEAPVPYNIKTVTFTQSGVNMIPIFSLNDSFEFSFDDLYGNEENYYYTLTHCDYNWSKSDLSRNEYLDGIDNQRIQEYENSFNTLQLYSHYKLSFPNQYTRIIKSGNYLLSIFNNDKELIFSKKFIIFEELSEVPLQIKRSRVVANNLYMHNLDFSIKSKEIQFQNPDKNVKVILLQNGKWNNAIVNIKPQYTIGNDLIFKYDKETQFYAGNEYLFFDNKDARAVTNTITRVDSSTGLYSGYLYTDSARKTKDYSFYPDVNGNYQIRNIRGQNNTVEADYVWVYFSLFAPEFGSNANIYVTGMFNNNALTPENKMDYNAQKGVFQKAIMIKQGFTNYDYTLTDKNNNVDQKNAIDGNYWQTGNTYTVMVYYRSNLDRYDRVIGKGEANSINIIN